MLLSPCQQTSDRLQKSEQVKPDHRIQWSARAMHVTSRSSAVMTDQVA